MNLPSSKIPLKIIELQNVAIFDQLTYEEYLLRDTHDNICLINHGSTPAIVMGISGKLEELVDSQQAKKLNIPIIKRYSGGGTVVIDENTLFVTFIFNAKQIDVLGFPEHIYKFTETIYKDVFKDLPFELKQNDYTLEDRKCGGNAQYIKKDRWLHHTSFLYDYNDQLMALLKHPKKTPLYRQQREHADFICKLKDSLASKQALFKPLINTLSTHFDIVSHHTLMEDFTPSRLSTEYISDFN